MSDTKLEDIVSLCKRRGFIYPGSEVYGGLAGAYDYGPLGVRLKRNIQNAWLKFFVDGWDDMYQVDAAILMNKKVWEASGHATGFNDPLVECSNCHSRLRADHVEGAKCPVCGRGGTLSEPRQFNMMFKTHVGPAEGDESVSYLRPETAQGIFVNFKNVMDSFYPDLPFGIAQIGKAFRNEISPREFLFRLRELEQMEIEYFVHPEDWETQFEKWRKDTLDFFKQIGLPEGRIHELEVPEEDRAHYSKRTIDFEFDYPFGRRELSGLAYRTDFDLRNIQKASGKSMAYRPKDGDEPFVPHVIEPSFGVDRAVLAVLSAAYTEDEVEGERRTYLKLAPQIAPVKVAVSPLLKNKPELVEKAREVYKQLKKEFGSVMWDDNGNIGKRYRRQDEIGTPYCVTIDFDTLQDNTVTVRNRDTTAQERVEIAAAPDFLKK
jgi:glycyl-tRNA synthetase